MSSSVHPRRNSSARRARAAKDDSSSFALSDENLPKFCGIFGKFSIFLLSEISFNSIFNVSITTFGIIGLILCLALRFITPAFKYLTASLNNISPSSQNALSGFSVSSLKAFLLFYFPQMRPAILMSMLVVFIEVIKEQPATLLLRPVGFETLSSKIYNQFIIHFMNSFR